MDLIQALKKADGKAIRRKDWCGEDYIIRVPQTSHIKWASGDDEHLADNSFFADDWYVAESVDDVIEREIDAQFKPTIGPQTIIAIRQIVRNVLAWQAENGK